MSRKERKCNGMKKIFLRLLPGLFLFALAAVLFFVHAGKSQEEEKTEEKVLVMHKEVVAA